MHVQMYMCFSLLNNHNISRCEDHMPKCNVVNSKSILKEENGLLGINNI